MLKAVIFDLDNTLIDWGKFFGKWEEVEDPNVGAVYNYLLTISDPSPSGDMKAYKQAYFRHTREAWEHGSLTHEAPHMGRTLVKAAATGGFATENVDARSCLEAYSGSNIDGVTVFPETVEVLTTLRDNNINLGLITNGYSPMWMRDKEMKHHDLLEFFPDCRFSSADEGYLKPHPHIFMKALARLQVSAKEAVFVGDNLRADVGGAQGVGMRGVWRITSSNGGILKDDIVPDAKINNLKDLLLLLDKWFPGWNKQVR